MNLNTHDICANHEIAALHGNGGADTHQLVMLHKRGCLVGNCSFWHVVSEHLLTVDVDDHTVGSLDGEGKRRIVVEVSDSESLSEVGGGANKVAELSRHRFLPRVGSRALRLDPVSRSGRAIVQELVGFMQRSNEVANKKVKVLGSHITAVRTEENNCTISKKDSEVAVLPAITGILAESKSVGACGFAERVIAGLIAIEPASIDERGA